MKTEIFEGTIKGKEKEEERLKKGLRHKAHIVDDACRRTMRTNNLTSNQHVCHYEKHRLTVGQPCVLTGEMCNLV